MMLLLQVAAIDDTLCNVEVNQRSPVGFKPDPVDYEPDTEDFKPDPVDHEPDTEEPS